MTIKQKHLLAAMKAEARRAQKLTHTLGKTGRWALGPVGVHYYPVCGRYTFFLYGEPVSQRSLMSWMSAP